MLDNIKQHVAILTIALALLSLPAAASANRTNVVSATQTTVGATASDTVVDIRLLTIDRELYPTTFEDHAYTCSDGNCTDW